MWASWWACVHDRTWTRSPGKEPFRKKSESSDTDTLQVHLIHFGAGQSFIWNYAEIIYDSSI